MVDITAGLVFSGILLTVYLWGKGYKSERNYSLILTIVSFILFGVFSDREEARINNDTDISKTEVLGEDEGVNE